MDKIFKPNYYKTMSTTNLVRSPRKWWRTWTMYSCLNCPRQTRKRNAKSVFFTGIKASFIALARISWKKAKPAEAPFNVHWTISQFQIMSSRRDDFMAIDTGKLKHEEIILLHIIWERDASRGIFKGTTIVLRTILNFMHLNSTMIEMKRSVSRWMN